MISPGELLADAALFPQRIDFLRQAIMFVRHTREDYRRASFLDGRILGAQTQGTWASFDQVHDALRGAAPTLPLHFIFHAGHVGSTLLSRLLEDAGGVLALREPLPLRLLAEAADIVNQPESLLSPARLDTLIRDQVLLWRRGFDGARAVILKATSSAARLAPRLLEAAPDAHAVYLNLKLEPYLATLLAGEYSIFDLRGHGPERIRRLRALGGDAGKPLYAMSAGELAGLAWLTETATQNRLADAFGPRALSVDFDVFLADISAALARICAHFNLDAPPSYFEGAARSQTMHAYAKAPEAAYSPDMRAALLHQARQLRADEIAKGAAWVQEALARAPLLPPSAVT